MECSPVPARVRRILVELERGDIFHPAVVQVGEGDDWDVLVNEELDGHQMTLGLEFRRRKNGKYRIEHELVIDGEKVSVDSLAEALMKMLSYRPANGASAVGGRSSAARVNSVEVRRSTVIRT